ncbi:MAG: SGNH/GDSL hydrolase family protein [Desulfobacula sp.]|nr:SGNH/GDSL hydrolase family protein [Desulfobacula sp.]
MASLHNRLPVKEKIINGYFKVSTIAFSLFIGFVAINLLAFIGIELKHFLRQNILSHVSPVYEKYGEGIYEAYPDMNRTEIDRLLAETWNRQFEYESVSQFKEKEYLGKYVNVSPFGFRKGLKQNSWPLDQSAYNVFVFGSSTTFGYGLPDYETIPSHINKYISQRMNKKVNVYNFGRAHYYSTHEFWLFARLLAKNQVPDLAIFIDGIDDFYYAEKDDLLFTDIFSKLSGILREGNVLNYIRRLSENLPIARVVEWASRHGEFDPSDNKMLLGENTHKQLIEKVINRYRKNINNINKISDCYGVSSVFFLQPTPTYKFDLKYHPFAEAAMSDHWLSGIGYAEFEKKWREGFFNDFQFLWGAELQQGETRSLYVDQLHYNSYFAKKISEYIVSNMKAM